MLFELKLALVICFEKENRAVSNIYHSLPGSLKYQPLLLKLLA